MEPFENFEEDQRSWEHLEKLPAQLRAEAVSIWGVNPAAAIAGLLIENGTELHPDIAAQFGGPLPDAKEGICAIVPVQFAQLVVARHGGTAAVETLQKMGEAKTGSLLVVVLTPNGLRCGNVRIWEPTPEDPTVGGPDFGAFTIATSRNDELKLLRQAVEEAKANSARPGEYFQRVRAREQRPDGSTFESVKLFCVDLRSGEIVVTESSAGMTYARKTLKVDSIG